MSEDKSELQPLVSVVMPVYNAGRFLREAIDSILRQDFADFEFVIVDDGSEDGSREVVRSYTDRRIRLIVNPANLGVVRSLNAGIEAARGTLVARMDADDVCAPDRLGRQVAFLREHEDVLVVGTFIENIDGQGRSFGRTSFPVTDSALRVRLRHGCPLAHPTVMMRRPAVVSAGLYREPMRHAEDYDLWLRMAERGKLANLPFIGLKYRTHQGCVTVTENYPARLHSLAAWRASEFRSRGEPDGIPSTGEMDVRMLDRLGIDAGLRAELKGRSQIEAVKRLLMTGDPEVAARKAELLGGSQVTSELRFETLLLQSRIKLLRRDVGGAVLGLVRHCAADTRFGLFLLRKLGRRLARRVVDPA